jgi:hypothetical protein
MKQQLRSFSAQFHEIFPAAELANRLPRGLISRQSATAATVAASWVDFVLPADL